MAQMRLKTDFLACVAVAVSTAHGQAFGPVQKGRTSFYGGAPDNQNPEDPSYGTLNGSCGYVFRVLPLPTICKRRENEQIEHFTQTETPKDP